MRRKTFGRLLRQMRRDSGIGIKRLGPDLGVTYGYVSKLENDVTAPSEDFVHRTADYFEIDPNILLLAAGKIPPDVMRILQDHPEEAVEILRKKFGGGDGERR